MIPKTSLVLAAVAFMLGAQVLPARAQDPPIDRSVVLTPGSPKDVWVSGPAEEPGARIAEPGAPGTIGGKPPFATLEKGSYGVWARPALLVLRSACEWIAAMAKLAAEGVLIILPGPAPPDVIWSRQTVVLVALGRMDGDRKSVV